MVLEEVAFNLVFSVQQEKERKATIKAIAPVWCRIVYEYIPEPNSLSRHMRKPKKGKG